MKVCGGMELILTQEQIRERVKELGKEITEYYRGEELMVVVLATGAIFFAADLLRAVNLTLSIDTLSVSSYAGTERQTELHFRNALKLNPKGKRVLVVDEILDSGRTLQRVIDFLKQQGATDIRSVVLMTKQIEHEGESPIVADWSGFDVPDCYLVGYGLDAYELYRNLPDVMALDKT